MATLLVRGFISFFTHLLNHKIPFLWRFHRVHHLDTELDVSSTVRFHPVEFVLSTFIGLPVVVAFGLSSWVLIFNELLDVAVTLFSHSNLRVPTFINRPLRYVIVTPDLHRVHHSAWQPETDSNFGAVFPIWDLIFGTFRPTPRDGHELMRLGLDDLREPEANRFLVLLLSPFKKQIAPPVTTSSSVKGSTPADHAGVAFHPPVLLVIAIALGFLGRAFVPLGFLQERYGSAIGPLVFALSWGLFLWAAAAMKRGRASIPCKAPTATIVATGPYRFSRNPIYLAMVLLQIGLGLWLNSLWFVGLAVLMASLLWLGRNLARGKLSGQQVRNRVRGLPNASEALDLRRLSCPLATMSAIFYPDKDRIAQEQQRETGSRTWCNAELERIAWIKRVAILDWFSAEQVPSLDFPKLMRSRLLEAFGSSDQLPNGLSILLFSEFRNEHL